MLAAHVDGTGKILVSPRLLPNAYGTREKWLHTSCRGLMLLGAVESRGAFDVGSRVVMVEERRKIWTLRNWNMLFGGNCALDATRERYLRG